MTLKETFKNSMAGSLIAFVKCSSIFSEGKDNGAHPECIEVSDEQSTWSISILREGYSLNRE